MQKVPFRVFYAEMHSTTLMQSCEATKYPKGQLQVFPSKKKRSSVRHYMHIFDEFTYEQPGIVVHPPLTDHPNRQVLHS